MEIIPMRLKSSLNGLAVVAASAAAVLAIPVGPASALVDYTVTSGGGTNAVTATNVGNLVFEDTYLGPFGTPGNPSMTCTTLSADGSVNPGGHAFTPTSPDPVTVTDAAGQVTPVSGDLSGCTNAVVGPVTLTPSGTWKLGLSSKSGNGGTGYLSGVQVHLYGEAGGETCQADAIGTLKGAYDGTTGRLTIDASYEGLVLKNVTSSNPSAPSPLCNVVGIYEDDPATGSGIVQLTPAPSIS
ncbi:hypothetical protein [Nocardioides sp. SLBN-35]|uniref:hypothetical protein n=2 Tax=unclassified Nocardioides TaxID=2615069 RepID=UPI0011546D38|nr:hypothetical protein [Nocardioides sp. SLBN-35]TQK69699.1 hypothetical protein FBY23_1465 [Nocardioides sp. SLBN-35]